MDTTTTSTGRPPISGSSHEPPSLPPESPSTRHHRPWVWLIALVLILGAGYFMYHQYQTAKMARQATNRRGVGVVPISTTVVRKGDVGVYVEGLGAVTPLKTVSVTSRVQGQIVAIHYREGQMVHTGDPLIDIDPRPYEAQLVQVEGQLARDQASLAQARIDLDRYRAALAQNAISQQQVYDQEQTVKQFEGTVKNDQGLVDNAKVNLAYCHITSPIDGRVGLRLLDLGNIVQANSSTALVVVTQLQPITVIFSVAEGYLPEIQTQLRLGHKMTVQALNPTGEKVLETGSLLTIDNQVDPTTGTIRMRAIFANPDSMLFPNQFVNAKLLVNTQHNANLVPTAAIQRNAQGPFLYVIGANQMASMQPVTVGTANGDVTAVQGVQSGQVIAIAGFDKLQNGAKVAVRNGNGKPGANTSASNSSNQDTEAP
jgi:membrane fusion protein, multidrug efflux system